MVRIIAPILKAVNRSWKMYPVGILFGFGESAGKARLRPKAHALSARV